MLTNVTRFFDYSSSFNKNGTQVSGIPFISEATSISTTLQQDFRILFKYFNYYILGLKHPKYILTNHRIQ